VTVSPSPDPTGGGSLGPLEDSYAQYRAALRAYFVRGLRREVTVAEDLVQEVYARLLRHPPREPVRDPEGYLFQVARNVLRDACRAARREQARFYTCPANELEGFAEAASTLWIENEGGEAVVEREFNQVLNQLPRSCRIAMLRHRRDGWTYEQIAAELGVSAHTVKDYIVKALAHFRAHFSKGSP